MAKDKGARKEVRKWVKEGAKWRRANGTEAAVRLGLESLRTGAPTKGQPWVFALAEFLTELSEQYRIVEINDRRQILKRGRIGSDALLAFSCLRRIVLAMPLTAHEKDEARDAIAMALELNEPETMIEGLRRLCARKGNEMHISTNERARWRQCLSALRCLAIELERANAPKARLDDNDAPQAPKPDESAPQAPPA